MKRKCLFRLIQVKDGREVMSEEREGLFHQWGNSFINFEHGPMQVTTALIEDTNGQVHEVVPSNIRFASCQES